MGRMTVAALFLFLATTMGALGSEVPRLCGVAYHPGDMLDGYQNVATRGDTLWFGGDDGNGVAVADEYWDFEDGTLQGCSSIDETENPGDYFEWAIEATYQAHGDPVIPIIEIGGTPTVGQIWCGIHQDEANSRDFVSGVGYQNVQCQRAFSPEFPVGIEEAPSIEFDYFCHSEPEYDYTRVYVLGFDGGGELFIEEELVAYDGASGDETQPWTTPVLDEILSVPAGVLDGAATFQFEFRMTSDGGWSDEDGLWDSPGGPFAFDNAEITYSGGIEAYDFDAGPEGWTFERCAGVGAYLHLVEESEYTDWLDQLGLACECTLTGWAAGFTGTYDPTNVPALFPGQKELMQTGILPRGVHQPPEWNAAIVQWDTYVNLPQATGGHYRPGYRYYPYTSTVNPEPHWSPRRGQNVWFYTSNPYCDLDDHNLNTLGGQAGQRLPTEWDSLRFCYEVYCSCDGFGTPPTVCTEEGWTKGAPLIDNIRIGLCHLPDAPPISWMDGGLLMDGFGQHFPTYLEPSDRCNVNASFNLSMVNTNENDWLADTTTIGGPTVQSEATRWLVECCFRIARTGARQHMIPEYHDWKARLPGDPEIDFVAVLMDSCMIGSNVWKNKFCTYIHESDPAFNQDFPQQSEANEILPDGIFVPGTRIEYYWRSFWFNDGAPPEDYYYLADAVAPREIEFLPTMTRVTNEEFAVQWPCVLYIDAFNRGIEQYIMPALDNLGIGYDKYDYLDAAS